MFTWTTKYFSEFNQRPLFNKAYNPFTTFMNKLDRPPTAFDILI